MVKKHQEISVGVRKHSEISGSVKKCQVGSRSIQRNQEKLRRASRANEIATMYLATISTMCDGVRFGLRCPEIPFPTRFGLFTTPQQNLSETGLYGDVCQLRKQKSRCENFEYML